MSKITLDPTLRAKLNGLKETLEICDESGETVGHFLPADVYRKLLYQIAEAQCPHTADELAKMRNQTGGVPLAEIWKRLGVK
ncbi:MAG: hypothetical protein HYR84_01625 [Planctomycetes bacterium]|nr:hypothetical protein [Planctomycetota bacterium]